MIKNLDSHYGRLYSATKSVRALEEAGWFDDSQWDRDEHLDLPTTPLQPLLDHDGDEVGVLYFPGCFAPLHQGHLLAMEEARRAVEAQGTQVALGLFAPEHSAYVGNKTQEPQYSSAQRVFALQEAVEDSSWMRVDMYPALYGSTALNFTRLLDRLEAYLARWAPGKRVRLFLVFGADNAYFAQALRPEVMGVCVPRPGYPAPVSDAMLIADTPGLRASSSSLRKRSKTSQAATGTFLLRDDLHLASTNTALEGKEREATARLHTLLQDSFGPDVKVKLARTDNVIIDTMLPTVSLDPFYPGAYNLAVSRPFEVSSGQTRTPSRLVARPGSPSLDEQLQRIPPDTYVLIDDDYFTGTTMALATELLERSGSTVASWVGLANEQGPFFDVADARDFFPGLADAGLVVRWADDVRRGAYCMPGVNLSARISLDPDRAWAFSTELRKLWEELGLEESWD